MVGAIVLGTVVIALTGLWAGARASRLIQSLFRAMTGLAGGDTAVEIVGTGRGNEIGEMARIVHVFRESAIKVERLKREQIAAEARARAEKQRAVAVLAEAFESMVKGIVVTLSSAATQEISRNVQEASAGTREVSANVAGVTEAADESGRSAGEALQAARDMACQAETLRGEVDHFLDRVRAA